MECISEKIYEQAINLPVDERLILIDKYPSISSSILISNSANIII